MLRTLSSIGVGSMVLALVGCTHVVPVAYSPLDAPARVQVKSSKRVKVEPFSDDRLTAMLMIAGETRWVVPSDVTEVITDAIKTELANTGYQIVAEGEDFILSGSVLIVAMFREPGVVTSYGEGGVRIRVKLKDVKEGKTVCPGMISGRSSMVGGAFGPSAEEVVNLAIKDLIYNLVTSEWLHAALK
ncbi:MAG: hypothetical protein V3W08_11115 [Candidatus Binatia bacterium]